MSSGAVASQAFAARTATIAAARHFATDRSAVLGCDRDVQSRVALIVSELASNAVEASTSDYTLAVEPDQGGGVFVTVTNRADRPHIPDREDWGPDDPLAARGRGLGIVESLATAVRVSTGDSTVAVTARISPA